MKKYLKPEAELIELKLKESIMNGELMSGEWGVEDGEDGGWDD